MYTTIGDASATAVRRSEESGFPGLPSYAAEGCEDAGRYVSACSCIGVTMVGGMFTTVTVFGAVETAVADTTADTEPDTTTQPTTNPTANPTTNPTASDPTIPNPFTLNAQNTKTPTGEKDALELYPTPDDAIYILAHAAVVNPPTPFHLTPTNDTDLMMLKAFNNDEDLYAFLLDQDGRQALRFASLETLSTEYEDAEAVMCEQVRIGDEVGMRCFAGWGEVGFEVVVEREMEVVYARDGGRGGVMVELILG